MSNDKNVFERLFKLWAMICKMILDGVRDPYVLADTLQNIVDQTKVCLRRLYQGEVIKLGKVVFSVYEINVNTTLAQLFGSLGALNQVAFDSLEQVHEFCQVHYNKLLARGYGYVNFFLFKQGEYLFVAYVNIPVDMVDTFGGIDIFNVEVGPFEVDHNIEARYQHRVVVPKL